MPDFAMCENEGCPKSSDCLRHKHAGAVPEIDQWWSQYRPDADGDCRGFVQKPEKLPADKALDDLARLGQEYDRE